MLSRLLCFLLTILIVVAAGYFVYATYKGYIILNFPDEESTSIEATTTVDSISFNEYLFEVDQNLL